MIIVNKFTTGEIRSNIFQWETENKICFLSRHTVRYWKDTADFEDDSWLSSSSKTMVITVERFLYDKHFSKTYASDNVFSRSMSCKNVNRRKLEIPQLVLVSLIACPEMFRVERSWEETRWDQHFKANYYLNFYDTHL